MKTPLLRHELLRHSGAQSPMYVLCISKHKRILKKSIGCVQSYTKLPMKLGIMWLFFVTITCCVKFF
ncbi:hypothetical protein MIDIC_110113 [Alphaproteobacteria bacterium]